MAETGRTFLRGMVSDKYALDRFREEQLAAPRVRGDDFISDDGSVAHSAHSEHSNTWWRFGPGDDPFLTQNIQLHFVRIAAGESNKGHGHQNEAAFYILQGHGHEIHDGKRYDWEEGDVVLVHTDSVHQHFNDSDVDVITLVMKAKSTWMFFGLLQQGNSGPFEDVENFGERQEWGGVWTPGVEDRKKVIKPGDREWRLTPDGWIRTRLSPETTDARIFSIDLYEQRIDSGSRSARHWHMADEVLYAMSGGGYCLQWEVQAELDDRYYARIAKEPSRWDFSAGDTIYVPQNTVHQFFNDRDEPLLLMSAQNRLIRYLGYDNVVYLESAPEYEGSLEAANEPVGSAP